eukprot:2281115-Pyramimonas_sp.AAC.1
MHDRTKKGGPLGRSDLDHFPSALLPFGSLIRCKLHLYRGATRPRQAPPWPRENLGHVHEAGGLVGPGS